MKSKDISDEMVICIKECLKALQKFRYHAVRLKGLYILYQALKEDAITKEYAEEIFQKFLSK